MIKVYDTSWKQIVVIKPPWTLSDILICLRKHWIGVFGFVMPMEAKPILECLSGFFGNITQKNGKQNASFFFFLIVTVHSFSSLSCDRSKASSKSSSPHSAI